MGDSLLTQAAEAEVRRLRAERERDREQLCRLHALLLAMPPEAWPQRGLAVGILEDVLLKWVGIVRGTPSHAPPALPSEKPVDFKQEDVP